MSWITIAIGNALKSMGFKDAGDSIQKCDLKKTGLIVVVVQLGSDSSSTPVDGAIVDIKGKSPFNKKSSKDGVAGFKPVEPDTYRIKVTLPSPLVDNFEKPLEGHETVPLGGCPVHIVQIIPLVDLKVRVVRRFKDKENKQQETALDGVNIHIEGPTKSDATTPKDAKRWAKFKKVKAGEYRISATSLGSHKDKHNLPGKAFIVIAPGETEREVTLEVKLKAKLRIFLIDKDDKAIAGKAWELMYPVHAAGKTGGNGLIEVNNMNLEWTVGMLKVDLGAPAPTPATPAPPQAEVGTGTPPHPPPIKPEDFRDLQPAKAEKPDGLVEWSLFAIAPLEDYDNEEGDKARLYNLGFAVDKANTTKAVKAYQRLYLKEDNGSGNLPDIKADLRKRHDKA